MRYIKVHFKSRVQHSFTLKTEAVPSSETSVNFDHNTCHIPQEGTVCSYRHETLKSCVLEGTKFLDVQVQKGS